MARHIGPDPDAVGSQIALRDSIKLTFPKKKVYAVGTPVSRFKYFGILDKIDESLLEDPLLIVLDLPNISRLDGIKFENYKKVIKIDHHPVEEQFSEIEYVREDASSTCEMIIELIENTNLKMNKEIASNLFLGVIADSDRFLVPTTTYKSLELVSKLIKNYNLDLMKLYNKLYERPLDEVKFQSYITLNMSITENGFGYIKLTDDVIKEYKVDSSSASNMVNNFNYIKELYAWAFVSYDQRQELHKVNIRSRGPIINEIAMKYNGGGHKYASGARIKNIADIDLLFKALDDACKEYKENL
ncbi:MAG: bifunctional oligoribonuclease/PAP phosphatase NrnA [Bacilli bacterium]|nr:bifunctional oligoribonuclease/PAP phosphatase NrnA [Bacilli bacterium]MDD3895519.1 bifunctional oligoribonuclease/PAP phosphatase NrnA [Bacilli bacterium]MDD4407573.1 bifunctional oligoribonuclease/PAP phosphatase NrnA [Bacilli bacterium]